MPRLWRSLARGTVQLMGEKWPSGWRLSWCGQATPSLVDSHVELTAPLTSLAAVWLADTAAPRSLDGRRDDTVFLINGDTAYGAVVAWPADGPLRLDEEGRMVEVLATEGRALGGIGAAFAAAIQVTQPHRILGRAR